MIPTLPSSPDTLYSAKSNMQDESDGHSSYLFSKLWMSRFTKRYWNKGFLETAAWIRLDLAYFDICSYPIRQRFCHHYV